MRVIGGIVVFGLLCLAAIALFVVMRSSGADAQAFAPGLQSGAIEVQGVERSFEICLPASYAPGQRYPIVMMLHGGGIGNGATVATATGLCAYVDRDRFIAVFPNAQGPQWNDGRSTTAWLGNDVAFLNALVVHVADTYGGDRTRAFIAGISNGGMMALRMACDSTATFRAYVAVVANLPADLVARCRPSRPLPILFMLSRDDPLMPWVGGDIPVGHLEGRRLGAGGRVISGPETVGFFAQSNGCSGESVVSLPERVYDGTSVQLHTYRCGRSPVELYEVLGGGHGWPGSRMERGPILAHLAGRVTQQIDATELAIDFFHRNGM